MNAFHLRMDRDFLTVKASFAIIIFFSLFIPRVQADFREYIIRDIGEPCGVPAGIALDITAHRVYWADRFNQSIRSANVDLQDVRDIVTGLGEPQGVAVDDVHGKIYWTDVRAGKIQRANRDGSSVEDVVTGLGYPYRLAVDPIGRKIYWTDPEAGKIQSAGFRGNAKETVFAGLPRPWGIALDSSARLLFWSDIGENRLYRASLTNPLVRSEIPLLSGERVADIAVDQIRARITYLFPFPLVSYSSCAERNYDGSARSTDSFYPAILPINSVGLAVGVIDGVVRRFRTDRTPYDVSVNGVGFKQYGFFYHSCESLLRVSAVNDHGMTTGAALIPAPPVDPTGLYVPGSFVYEAVYRHNQDQTTILGSLMNDSPDHERRQATATCINDNGSVGGFSDARTEIINSAQFIRREHGFISNGSELIDIGTLGDFRSFSFIFGINDVEDAVGYSYINTLPIPATRGCLYRDGVLQAVGDLQGGVNSYASAINNAGQIVGRYETSDGQIHACVWDSTGSEFPVVDIGTLGGPFSQANDINASGQIVGESWTSQHERHAFLYNEGRMSDLGTLGGDESVALAIDDAGVIVGKSMTVNGNVHAFIYRDGIMTDLNDFRPQQSAWEVFVAAKDINNHGQIVGDGEAVDVSRPFMLTPLIRGDVNCDGIVDQNDAAPFVLAVIDAGEYATVFPDCGIEAADVNSDHAVNGADVQSFVEIIVVP